MKNRTALSVLSVLLALILLLSVGCSRRRAPDSDSTDTAEPETEAPASDSNGTKPEYHLVFDTVDYISEEEKEAWRPHLIRRLSNIEGLPNENLPEGEYAIGAHHLYALFDLNLDGVPELLGGCGNYGSGFCTAFPYCFMDAYDLYTGRKLETKHFFVSSNTSVHYDVERGAYEIYSVDYETSSFNAAFTHSGNFVIDRVEVLYDCFWFPDEDFPSEEDTPIVVSTAYLHTSIGTKGLYSEETVDDEDGSNRFTTIYNDPTYTFDGESCEFSVFFNELLKFMNTHISLRETQLQFVSTFYDSLVEERPERVLENAELFADQLLSSGQQFVRPIVREESTTSEVTP